MPPWFIYPISSSLLSGLAPTFWSYASGLKETPRAGRRRATGFPVLVYLLPLLCWPGARTMSIHRMCVIPWRRCSCSAGLVRLIRLHDTEVGFVGLHQQRLCGNVPAHSVFKGMNTTATPLPFKYIDKSWERVCRGKKIYCEPQQYDDTICT
jgi:hypothetical protein